MRQNLRHSVARGLTRPERIFVGIDDDRSCRMWLMLAACRSSQQGLGHDLESGGSRCRGRNMEKRAAGEAWHRNPSGWQGVYQKTDTGGEPMARLGLPRFPPV